MMSTRGFDLLAAIDLHRGRVVRLRQGDFARETRYGDDPVSVARRLVNAGARWLHVVDLEGARSGMPAQESLIGSVVTSVHGVAAVEVAGGRRTVASVGDALDAGAARVVLGTAAVREARFAGRVLAAFGTSRIAVALDVLGGTVLTDGWTAAGVGVPVERALQTLADQGVETFEVTAVERDGTLGGPDLELLDRLVQLDRGRIIASGGIGTIDDLRRVWDIGCAGAIVGRALYEGRLGLAEALAIGGGWPGDRPPSSLT
jgi:phosphoribosylformimino-5-aminoimidazole carboxamide ribotide isomerase